MGSQELMAAAYGRVYRELHSRHWWWRAREAYVLRWLERLGRGGGARILDVGCGDGLMWDRLEAHGTVEGIEPDARLVPPDSPRRSRIEISSFPGGDHPRGRYDFVLLLDVLEHIEDDVAALRRAAVLLGERGHLILTVPALMWLWSEFDVLNGHARRYTRASLRRALDAAGLEIVSLRYYYLWTVLPLLARRLLFRASEVEGSRFVEIPPAPINRLLLRLSLAEHRATEILGAPIGSSLIAVARRRREAA